MAGTEGLLRSTFSRLRRLKLQPDMALDGDAGDSPLIAAGHTAEWEPAAAKCRREGCSGGFGGDTELHMACGAGNLELVQQLVLGGADVDAKGAFEFTPMFWATQSGHSAIVRALIRGGAAVDAMDVHGSTPLLLAVVCGCLEIVHVLLAEGADPDAPGSCEPPLHCAVATGNVPVLEALVAAGANTAVASQRDGKTALHAAVMADQLECVRILLGVSSPVDARDSWQFTPLHFAAGRGHVDIAQCLLSAGADVAARDVNSFTPIHLAAGGGHTRVVQQLLGHGADVNCMTHPHGLVPIVLAAAGCYKDTTDTLLQAGAVVQLVEPSAPRSRRGRNDLFTVDERSVQCPANVLEEKYELNPLANHKVKMDGLQNYQKSIQSTLKQLSVSSTQSPL